MAGDRQGIVIRFLSDLADFLTGKNRAKDELKDLGKGLDEVGDKSDEQAKKTADGFRDVEQAAADAGDAVEESGDQADQAGDKLEGIGGKAAASLLAIVGLAGGVAGAVNAVIDKSIGFVTGLVDEQVKAAAKLKEDLAGAYQAAAEAGRNYLDQAQIIAEANATLFDPDKTKLNKFKKAAELIGVELTTYLLAQSGSYEDLKTVIDAARVAEETRGRIGEDKSKAGQAAALKESQAVDAIIRSNERLLGIHDENRATVEQALAVSEQLSQSERDRIARTSAAEQQRFEKLAAAMDAAAGKKVTVPVGVDITPAERTLAAWRARFTTGSGARLTIVADVVDRYGRELT